jgi:circadian clock protein KaiC
MNDDTPTLVRFPSGIPGLDRILGGGMFVGGIYLVGGRPGLGKTILANQIAYGHALAGGRVVYLTLLSESHARLMLSLESMSFFKREVVGDAFHYLSGLQALEKGKLDGLMATLRKVVRDQNATLLVIDGLVTAGVLAESSIDLKIFIHELQVLVELVGCTTLLLTGGEGADAENYAQRTMVDGLITLKACRVGLQTVREIEIEKHRASPQVMGASFYEISDQGIHIYPRTEAALGLRATEERARPSAPMATGIAGLDAMMNGGVQPHSTTMVLGSPGSGKTLFGLNFLAAGAKQGQAGFYFGFFETPARIAAKARSVGFDLPAEGKHGGVEIQWHAPQEQLADRLAEKLLERVSARKVKRLFIDGLAGFRRAVVYPERIGPFFTSLSNELRARGVTTVVSEDARGLFGPGLDTPADGTTAMVESIVFLRYEEQGPKLRRLISLIKMREGRYDSSVRELSITERGLAVGDGRERKVGRSPRGRKPRTSRNRG